MFEEVILNEMDEAEFSGRAPGNIIKFSKLNDWLNKVGASANAKYLKCLMPKKGVFTLFNISDIVFSENLIHRNAPIAHGVTIAFKEDNADEAMSIAKATELFNAIAAKCAEAGISTDDLQVFTMDPTGKLSTFCWFYDQDLDTAVVVKNMLPSAAKKFLTGAATTLADIVKTPRNTRNQIDKLMDKLAAIEAREKALAARKDELVNQLSQAKVG